MCRMYQNEERQLFSFVKRNLVTIEPVAFLTLFSSILSSTASDYITIDKVCRVKLKIDDDICHAIQRQKNPSDEYDQMVFSYFMVHSLLANVITCLVPCVLLLFIGGWSDRTGHRRVILLLPVIGRSLQIISSSINIIFYHEIPLEVHLYFNEFIVNIFGGHSLMIFALYTYVFVTSSVEQRIYRITSITVCATTGLMLGMSLCRFLQGLVDHGLILGLALVMNALISVYLIYAVSDPKRTNEQIMCDEQTLSAWLKNFFSVEYIKETAQVICKKTPNNREIHLCLQLLSMGIMFSVMFSEKVNFSIIAKYSYGWEQSSLNQYNVLSLTISTIGLLINVGVISRWLECHDSVIGIVSSVGRIISSLVYCFVEKHIFFIGPIVSMLNGSSTLAMASLFSKSLENHEVGKLSALVCVIANLVRLVYLPLYIILQALVSHTLPGAVYLLRAAYTLPVLFVFIWLLRDHRKEPTA